MSEHRNAIPTNDRSAAAQIGFAAVSTAIAVIARATLDPTLGDAIPWVTFFPAVLLSALAAGAIAAATTLVACAVVGQIVFVSPHATFDFPTTASLVSLVAFVVNGGLVGIVGVALRRALRLLEERTAEARAAAAAIRSGEATLRMQIEDLTRLHEFGTGVVGTHDRESLLRTLLEATVALQGAGRGFVEIYDSDRRRLVPGVSVGHDVDLFQALASVPVGEGEGACGTAAARRERVIVEDVEADPLFDAYRDKARAAGFRAVWSTPLFTRRGDLVGVLSTHFDSPHRPTEREVQLVELYGRLAADAIDAATLYERAAHARAAAETALEAVRERDRRKDEFLAMLAHELRNPLAPIRNALAVLRMLGPNEARPRRMQDIIDRQLGHLTRLVDDLLDVSRITRGQIVLEKEALLLSQIVEQAIETARPAIDQNGHVLSVMFDADPIRLEGDRARLVQVLGNLLANAAKFTPRGGQMFVTTARDGGDAIVKIRDTGVGIEREMQERVFDLFAQEQTSLARSHGGLGIGLTLVRRLVELHGGHVAVRSEGRGCGCEFAVALPALPPAKRAATRTSAALTDGRTQALVD